MRKDGYEIILGMQSTLNYGFFSWEICSRFVKVIVRLQLVPEHHRIKTEFCVLCETSECNLGWKRPGNLTNLPHPTVELLGYNGITQYIDGDINA